MGTVWGALRTAHWGWIGPLIAVTLVAHALRAWRWTVLLEAVPSRPDAPGAPPPVAFGLSFASVLIGYLVNYAAPRLGEFARAANLSARTRYRFPAVFGTVVAERVLDMLTLVLALGSVTLIYRSQLSAIAAAFVERTQNALASLPMSGVALVALGLGTLLLTFALGVTWIRRRDGRMATTVSSLVASFRDGLASLIRAKRPATIIFTTLGIWGAYAAMAYLPLLMLGLSEPYALGPVDAWAVTSIGAIGMALPAPGGTGSYHYATVQTLTLLFGVAAAEAATYALLTHAAQLVFFCAAGAAALLWQGTSLGALTTRANAARRATQT